MEFLAKILTEFKWAIAGFIGACVSVPFQSDIKSAKGMAVFVFSGSACAHFLTGLVGGYFSIEPSSAGGIGFLLGAFGGSLMAAVLKAIEQIDIASLIRSRMGGNGE